MRRIKFSIEKNTLRFFKAAVIFGLLFTLAIFNERQPAYAKSKADKSYKIMHIASYHMPWEWTEGQYQGFKDALSGLNVEHRVFYMDTKRRSTEQEKQEAGRQARGLIDTWKPDLVFTTDDNAQIYAAKYYINSDIPFVFSGVNGEPEDFGFVGSKNNAGILEREHSVETINFLRELAPAVKKIAVITDTDPTWPPMIERIKLRVAKEIPEIQFVSWDIVNTYAEYQQKIKEYDTKADAVIHLGDFTYKDEQGKNVPFQQVEEWTVKNSRLPDACFWEDRVRNGYLVAMAISGYEQGKEAGIMAKSILAEGKSPSTLGFKPTFKGQPVINLARAKGLGIKVKSGILLTAKVFNKFEWEK